MRLSLGLSSASHLEKNEKNKIKTVKYEQKRGISEMQRNELVVQRMQLFLYTKYSKNNLKKLFGANVCLK